MILAPEIAPLPHVPTKREKLEQQIDDLDRLIDSRMRGSAAVVSVTGPSGRSLSLEPLGELMRMQANLQRRLDRLDGPGFIQETLSQ